MNRFGYVMSLYKDANKRCFDSKDEAFVKMHEEANLVAQANNAEVKDFGNEILIIKDNDQIGRFEMLYTHSTHIIHN